MPWVKEEIWINGTNIYRERYVPPGAKVEEEHYFDPETGNGYCITVEDDDPSEQ